MKLLFNPTGSSKKPGVLIPIPQYPLYSATVAEFNMHQVNPKTSDNNTIMVIIWNLAIIDDFDAFDYSLILDGLFLRRR